MLHISRAFVFQVQILRVILTTVHSNFYCRTCLGYVL